MGVAIGEWFTDQLRVWRPDREQAPLGIEQPGHREVETEDHLLEVGVRHVGRREEASRLSSLTRGEVGDVSGDERRRQIGARLEALGQRVPAGRRVVRDRDREDGQQRGHQRCSEDDARSVAAAQRWRGETNVLAVRVPVAGPPRSSSHVIGGAHGRLEETLIVLHTVTVAAACLAAVLMTCFADDEPVPFGSC